MKSILTILILVLGTQIATAQWFSSKRVKGNGNVVIKTFSTDDYDGISVSNSADVELIEGTEGTIKVEAESNIMEHLEIYVKGDRLKIGAKKGVNISTRKGIKVWVPVKKISSVSLAGSGDIYSDMILRNKEFNMSIAGSGDIKLHTESEELNASIAGSGDMKLKGRTENLNASVAGSGDISAFAVKANSVDASVAGSGDISIFCNGGEINASIVGSGDVRYKGNTSKVSKTVIGSGDITKM